MKAMIVKEFRELFRDRRTLAMLVVLPLLLLIIFGYAANFYVSSVTAAVVGPQAEQVAAISCRRSSMSRSTEPAATQADAEHAAAGQQGRRRIGHRADPDACPAWTGRTCSLPSRSSARLNKAGDCGARPRCCTTRT